jgi:hypothetical protein
MDFARKLALGILSPLFIILLFATAFDVGFIRTATHPVTVKKLVAESGIYDTAVLNVLQQTKTIQTSVGNFSASDPIIQNAAKTAITPQYVQQNTEVAIDNIYQWLDGQIAQPNFSFDLSGAKNAFAEQVAGGVQQKLSTLSACTPAQNLAIAQSGSYDAVNANCLPKGVTPASAASNVKAGILNNQDFIKETKIGAANVKGDNPNQSVFDQSDVKNIPKQYQRAKKTPFILAILTILAGAGIVFLSRSWQVGLRHIGINLVVIGIIMLVFSWALNRTVSTKITPKIKVDNAILQQNVRNLVTDLAQQVDKNYWWFGGVYTVLGGGAIAAAEVFRRRSQPQTAHNKGVPETGDANRPEQAKKTSSVGQD